MSGQLSYPESTWRPTVERRSSRRRVVVDVVAILLVFVLAGIACGFLWEHVWTPPGGVAYQHRWVLDGEGLPNDFSGTGIFALVGGIAGLALGGILALLFDRNELVSLAAIAVGACLATALMWAVGTALGPADPHVLARSADNFDPIPGDLAVHGGGAFLALPAGAMLGVAAVYILLGARHRTEPTGPEHP